MDSQQQAIAREFDSYRESYADTVNASLGMPGLKVDFFTRVKADYFVDILDKELGDAKTASVLDVGCGVGIYHQNLSARLGKLSGVDVSSECVETAKARNPNIDYAAYDGARLPYEDGSFDAVVTICVMHHVPTSMWENFASEMARVLRPGGVACVFEHNPKNPVTMKIVDRCPFDADAVLLKSEKTESLLSGAALTDVKSKYILSVPAANRPLRAADRLFSRIPFGAQYYTLGRKA